MQRNEPFSMPVRIVGSALLLLGVAIGCSEYDQGGVTIPSSPEAPVMATSTDCDGSYNCKLPNPYPRKNAAGTFSSGTKEYYGDGYYYAPTGVTSDAATVWFYLPAAQTRTVDAWWTTYGNRSSTAPYIAYNASGTELGRVSPEFDAAIREAGAVRITWAHLRTLLS